MPLNKEIKPNQNDQKLQSWRVCFTFSLNMTTYVLNKKWNMNYWKLLKFYIYVKYSKKSSFV